MKKTCIICGSSFTAERVSKTYCSDRCRKQAFLDKRNEEQPERTTSESEDQDKMFPAHQMSVDLEELKLFIKETIHTAMQQAATLFQRKESRNENGKDGRTINSNQTGTTEEQWNKNGSSRQNLTSGEQENDTFQAEEAPFTEECADKNFTSENEEEQQVRNNNGMNITRKNITGSQNNNQNGNSRQNITSAGNNKFPQQENKMFRSPEETPPSEESAHQNFTADNEETNEQQVQNNNGENHPFMGKNGTGKGNVTGSQDISGNQQRNGKQNITSAEPENDRFASQEEAMLTEECAEEDSEYEEEQQVRNDNGKNITGKDVMGNKNLAGRENLAGLQDNSGNHQENGRQNVKGNQPQNITGGNNTIPPQENDESSIREMHEKFLESQNNNSPYVPGDERTIIAGAKEEPYQYIDSPLIEEITEINDGYYGSGDWERFCPKEKISATRTINKYIRCLLENTLKLSRYREIPPSELLRLIKAYRFLMESKPYKEVYPEEPGHDSLYKMLCGIYERHSSRKTLRLILKKKWKAEIIAELWQIGDTAPLWRFSKLYSDDILKTIDY